MLSVQILMQPRAQTAPDAPVLNPSQITIAGAPLQGAQAIYQGLRAQARVLGQQMSDLQETRVDLTRQLEHAPTGVARTGLEQRIAGIDSRIASVDKQIADADAQVAKAAAIPGAAVEPPRIDHETPPAQVFFVSAAFITGALLLPLSIAYARRMWKHTGTVVAAFPKEIAERLGRVEQSVDATAVEVERIGEGQRFLTKLFTEGNGFRAIGAPAGELVERKSGDVR